MILKPKFCPECYTPVAKIPFTKDRNGKKIKVCPNCKIQLICDESYVYVRCPTCQRVFSDTLTYGDHLDKDGKCSRADFIKVINSKWFKKLEVKGNA